MQQMLDTLYSAIEADNGKPGFSTYVERLDQTAEAVAASLDFLAGAYEDGDEHAERLWDAFRRRVENNTPFPAC